MDEQVATTSLDAKQIEQPPTSPTTTAAMMEAEGIGLPMPMGFDESGSGDIGGDGMTETADFSEHHQLSDIELIQEHCIELFSSKINTKKKQKQQVFIYAI
jgi:hypothetical protein